MGIDYLKEFDIHSPNEYHHVFYLKYKIVIVSWHEPYYYEQLFMVGWMSSGPANDGYQWSLLFSFLSASQTQVGWAPTFAAAPTGLLNSLFPVLEQEDWLHWSS